MEHWELKQMQSLPLEAKIIKTQQRIKEWYEHWDGNVYVSFSGGIDSTVLLHIVREMYPEVPAVFADTGLEYPKIREFVSTVDNVRWMQPKTPFTTVIKEQGFPVGSKKVSRAIRDLQNPTDANKNVRNLYLTGLNKKGETVKSFKLAKRWIKLIDGPYKFSEKCCDITKKEPFKRYEKETKRKPIAGTMADESGLRASQYLKTGCNSFNGKRQISNPLGFWTRQDVLQYILQYSVSYCEVYGYIIVDDNGNLDTSLEKRTGCMFCMFGVQLEKGENRFQRMKRTDPKIYDYCINQLGIGEVLDFIGVKYA